MVAERADAPREHQAASSNRCEASTQSSRQAWSIIDQHSRDTGSSRLDFSPDSTRGNMCRIPTERNQSTIAGRDGTADASGQQQGDTAKRAETAKQHVDLSNWMGQRDIHSYGFPRVTIDGADKHMGTADMRNMAQRANDMQSLGFGTPRFDNSIVFTDPSRFTDRAARQEGVARQDAARQQGTDRQPAPTDQTNTPQLRLLDRNASPEERLREARDLANAGVRDIRVTNADGSRATLRPNVINVGGRDLISLHMTDASGRTQTVLRGIQDQDNSIHQQRDASGQFVDYYGRGRDAFERLQPRGIDMRMNDGAQSRQRDPEGTAQRRDRPPMPDDGMPERGSPNHRDGGRRRDRTPDESMPERGAPNHREGGRHRHERQHHEEGGDPTQRPERQHHRRGHEHPRQPRPDQGEGQRETDQSERRGPQGGMSELQHRIADAARRSEGQKMWRRAGFRDGEVNGGVLGCAGSVSGVLMEAGVQNVRSAGVSELAQQLRRAGATRHEISEGVRPGDVVILSRHPSGRHGHTGIIGEDGGLWNNSGGQWRRSDLQRDLSTRVPGSYVLRFEDQNGHGSPYYRHRAESERIETQQNRPAREADQQAVHNMFDRAAAQARGSSLKATNEGVLLQGMLQVDADGSPRAKQLDPKNGNLKTSYQYRDGSYVNAETVPYAVMPSGEAQRLGLRLGDFGIVRDTTTGRLRAFVYAENGPPEKRGEGSMNLVEEMGYRNNPRNGGSNNRDFQYLFFPGSGSGVAANEAQLMQRLNAFRQRMGVD